MWFKFPKGENIISVERQTFVTEYTDNSGSEFFRAPDHFREKLVRDGGCVALAAPPAGVPENLPDLTYPEKSPGADDKVLALQQELSSERSSTSALRAELSATLHERDQLKLQVHELTQKVEELESRIENEGLEEIVAGGPKRK